MTFVKGQSGNPAGRAPYKNSLKVALEEALTKSDRRDIARAVVALAVGGNMEAIKFIFDRIDGKVKDQITFEQPGPIQVIVEYVDAGPIDPIEAARAAEDGIRGHARYAIPAA